MLMGAQLQVVSNEQQPDVVPDFATFWALYPKRVARKDAERAFARVSANDYAELFAGLVGWRKVWLARGEMQYVPNAATWLNGERWMDEIPSGVAPISQGQVPFEKEEKFVRDKIPEHIQTAIRKALKK